MQLLAISESAILNGENPAGGSQDFFIFYLWSATIYCGIHKRSFASKKDFLKNQMKCNSILQG